MMSRRQGIALKALVGILAIAGLGGASFFGLLPLAKPQTPLEVFAAPSALPAGESWVFIGSKAALPEDLAVTVAPGVSVLETRRLSASAIAARVEVAAGAAGSLLGVHSSATGGSADAGVRHGASIEAVARVTSFQEDDLVDGALPLLGSHLFYGIEESPGRPLAALRIHNRNRGEWTSQEYAVVRENRAREGAPFPVDPAFVETDVFVTLPDTDGDGVYDFEVEETPRPELHQVAVQVSRGALNVLDVVAIDEAGVAHWSVVPVMAY